MSPSRLPRPPASRDASPAVLLTARGLQGHLVGVHHHRGARLEEEVEPGSTASVGGRGGTSKASIVRCRVDGACLQGGGRGGGFGGTGWGPARATDQPAPPRLIPTAIGLVSGTLGVPLTWRAEQPRAAGFCAMATLLERACMVARCWVWRPTRRLGTEAGIAA